MSEPKEWCIQGSHFVDHESMTLMKLQSGGKRRLCQKCKNSAIAIKKREQLRNRNISKFK